MKSTYIDAVIARIGGKTAQKQIAAELESHLADKTDYYIDLGYPPEVAAKRAEEDMGDPDDTALPLRELHPKFRDRLLLIATAVTALGTAALGLFDRHFAYASGTYRAVFHRISVDWISLGILAAFAALLVLAWRRKNKWIPLLLAAGLAVAACGGCTVFRPAVFAAVKLATAGFGGYADSLFSYAIFPEGLCLPVLIGSAAVFAVLEIWAILQGLAVFRQERMRGTKPLRCAARVCQTAAVILLAAETALMGVGAAVAIPHIDSKHAAMRAEKAELFELLLKGDENTYWNQWLLKGDENTDWNQLLTDNGWQPYYIDGAGTAVETVTYCRSQSNNTVMTAGSSVWYSQTNFDAPLPLWRDSEVLTAAQTKELERQRGLLKGGYVIQPYTLQDLQDGGLLEKAVTLSNEPSDMVPQICRARFFAATENGVQPVELVFESWQNDGLETFVLIQVNFRQTTANP